MVSASITRRINKRRTLPGPDIHVRGSIEKNPGEQGVLPGCHQVLRIPPTGCESSCKFDNDMDFKSPKNRYCAGISGKKYRQKSKSFTQEKVIMKLLYGGNVIGGCNFHSSTFFTDKSK